jgi:hypothetical protein
VHLHGEGGGGVQRNWFGLTDRKKGSSVYTNGLYHTFRFPKLQEPVKKRVCSMNKNTIRMEGYTFYTYTTGSISQSDMMGRRCTERRKTKRGVMKVAYLEYS